MISNSLEVVFLLGTNISHPKALLEMLFLFARWDMLVPWRVFLQYRCSPSTFQILI